MVLVYSLRLLLQQGILARSVCIQSVSLRRTNVRGFHLDMCETDCVRNLMVIDCWKRECETVNRSLRLIGGIWILNISVYGPRLSPSSSWTNLGSTKRTADTIRHYYHSSPHRRCQLVQLPRSERIRIRAPQLTTDLQVHPISTP